jgi:hypothetical protein
VNLVIESSSGITSIDDLPLSLTFLYINACHTYYNFDNLPLYLTTLSITYITHCNMDYLPPYLKRITLFNVKISYWPNNKHYYNANN